MTPWYCHKEGCTASIATGQIIYRVSDLLDSELTTACVQHLPELQAEYAAQQLKKKYRMLDD